MPPGLRMLLRPSAAALFLSAVFGCTTDRSAPATPSFAPMPMPSCQPNTDSAPAAARAQSTVMSGPFAQPIIKLASNSEDVPLPAPQQEIVLGERSNRIDLPTALRLANAGN